MQLSHLLNAITGGVLSGVLCWLLLQAVVRVAPLVRLRLAFGGLVLNAPGELARENLARAARNMLLLGAAACAAVGGFVAFAVLAMPSVGAVLMWVIFVIACALIVVWAIFLVRGYRRWRVCRFASRADVAIGAALDRLAMQGHRVFHDVALGKQRFEHVVVGPRGLFVIRTVTRRPRRNLNVVRLHGRTLEFQDGLNLPDPAGEVEQGAHLLSELAGRLLNHPVQARAVLAVPGWEVSTDQAGDLLLVNEKTAIMLLGWSRAGDHLLNEDAPALQERLVRLSISRNL
ncbi:MAG: NERD domain-containing protein [Gammaproteobacteria bacterium]|nr:NERD domain-containing protein [Gammaproteobacteria bacterium]